MVCKSLQAQVDSYKISKTDTIFLPEISYKPIVALHFTEAIVLVEYQLFLKRLTGERNGLKKEIKSRERMIKKGTDYSGITSSQLKYYQSPFDIVEPIFQAAKRNKLDTLHLDHLQANATYGYYIPQALENQECIVTDLQNNRKKYIFKLSVSKNTRQNTSLSSTFLFIRGATKYFCSKMDWVN